MCNFNFCELYNGLLIGITASVVASFFVWVFANYTVKKKQKMKYGRAEGKYRGYGYSKSDSDLVLMNEQQSQAEITYVKENILCIEVTPCPNAGKYKWKGIITMELENYGSIAWRYEIYKGEKLAVNKHKFGFKRLIIHEDETNLYIYLVDENLDSGEKYDREVFIRSKKNKIAFQKIEC